MRKTTLQINVWKKKPSLTCFIRINFSFRERKKEKVVTDNASKQLVNKTRELLK